MSLEKLLCWTLTSLLLTSVGSGQTPPAQCVHTFRIEQDRSDIYIMPEVVNCFSCALDTMGRVAWQVDNVAGELVPASISPDTGTDGNFLVIAMPKNYVLPGTSGRRDILCTSIMSGRSLEARLASPILQQPFFQNATVVVNEGDILKITCITRNIPDITTFEVLDPNGMPLSTVLGVFIVPNVTCSYAGTYTCVVTSTLDNSTMNETSKVTIEYSHPCITTPGDGYDSHPSTTVPGDDQDSHSSTAAPQDDHENESQLLPIVSATVIPVVMLMGIALFFGIIIIYLVSKKPIRLKKQTNQWSSPHDLQFEMENVAIHEQGAKDQKSCEATADLEYQQDSRTENTLIYADIGLNTLNQLQKFTVTDDSRVQYAVIDHNAKAPASELPSTGDELKKVDLDALLILLREELAPKWYEFGMVVEVPKELMDSYSGYPSDQCLTEVLDYWLRHHSDQVTWTDVAHALRAIKLNELAEKVPSSMTPNAQNATESHSVKRGNDDDCRAVLQEKVAVTENDMADVNSPKLPPKPKVYVSGAKFLPATECEDTAQDQPDVQPPPLPPKSELL